MDTNLTTFYVVQHKVSCSEAHIECDFDINNNPRVSSVKMLSGKIISLNNVKDALNHFKESNNFTEDPQSIA